MNGITNLQTDLLRTFVSVVELGGHSKAGEALGRSQPAISLQMRRLEELIGASLLTRDGRKILPTREGEALLGFARDIVRINDEAVHYFHKGSLSSALRIGVPTDYAMAALQTALMAFTRANPEVEIEMHCNLSCKLHEQLAANELDIIVAMMPSLRMPYLSRSWVEQPVWAAAADLVIDPDRPVPVAAHPEGCNYRERMIDALEAEGKRWRVTYSGSGISGLQSAVLNGLGVSALTQPTLLEGMRVLGPESGFPPLERLRVGLFYKHPSLPPAGITLVSRLIAKLDEIGVSDQSEPT